MKQQTQLRTFFLGLAFAAFLLLNGSAVQADNLCQGLPDGKECKIGADSHSYTPGTCLNQNCVASGNGTTLTTPSTGPGSAGQISSTTIPGTVTEGSDIVQCGRAGQQMCTLCDLIAGLNNVIQFVMKISIGVGLLAFTIAGVTYIVSGGDSGLTGQAKDAMKNAAKGFVIIFAGWLIINTAISTLGAKTDANGNPTFGMNITSWGQFDCNARIR